MPDVMSPPLPPKLVLLLALSGAVPAVQAQEATPAPAPTPAPTPAPDPAAAATRIEITGSRASDTEQRRQSTAAKIIIGREEIEKFGDSSLGEVLRRLPGVTTPGAPGRGGPPRLRGLGGGYTQLLIDGQRVPPGFSLESLTPEQVERIEVLRAPTAETGARAIAGTINIITREGFRRRLNDLRLGVGIEDGAVSPGLNWTRNDSAGPLTATLSGALFARRQRSESSTETVETALADGSLLQAERETTRTADRRTGLNATGRLQWRLSDSGDTLLLAPSLFHSSARSDRRFTLQQDAPATPPAYDLADSQGRSSFTNLRLNTQWRQRLGTGTRLELNGNGGAWRARGDSVRQEFRDDGTLLRTLQDSSRTREHTLALNAKLSQTLGGSDAGPASTADSAHSLVSGLETEAVRRREQRSGDLQADDATGNLQASSLRLAAYVQDEWSLTPHWALHAGLRWEGITTDGTAADGSRPRNRSSVATPLLHVLWKPDPKGRDQVRFSLTRSYRSPALGTLIGNTTINSKFDPSGPNEATSPDRAGNPALQPELATGIDLALERYLAGGGLLSANVFHRRIQGLMRSVTTLETVDYSPVQRWVARQQNIGDATTQGLELEAKFPLDTLLAGAPRVELRANLGLFRSRVDGVPGPDNRLDQQARATGNLGADHRWRGLPLTVGGNLNWVPATETQLSDVQRTRSGGKRVFDAFALWTFDPGVALRLMASNLDARHYDSSNRFTTATSTQTASTTAPTDTNWQLRLELKL